MKKKKEKREVFRSTEIALCVCVCKGGGFQG